MARCCSRCRQHEPKVSFYTSTRSTYCRDCMAAYGRERAAARKAGTAASARVRLSQALREGTPRDLALLTYAEDVVRQCTRAYHALDVLTSGWAAHHG